MTSILKARNLPGVNPLYDGNNLERAQEQNWREENPPQNEENLQIDGRIYKSFQLVFTLKASNYQLTHNF